MPNNQTAAVEDQDFIVYETIDEESEVELDPVPEPISDQIDIGTISHGEALKHFTEVPTLLNESIVDRVRRIHKDIEAVKSMGGNSESRDLVIELQQALQAKPIQSRHVNAANKQSQTVNDIPTSKAAFSSDILRLESRISLLEDRLGASVRTPVLSSSIAQTIEAMQSVLNLLTSNPDHLETQLQKLRTLELPKTDPLVGQINWLYPRLKAMDSEIKLLPRFISRLQSLKMVHAETIDSINLITETNNTMSRLEKEMQEWRATLETLEEKVEAYMKTSDETIHKFLTKS